MSLSAALGRRRSSADQQPATARRISGPLEGSFVHLNGTQELNASQVVASAEPIFSPMRAHSPELVKPSKSSIGRRLTKTFSPFTSSSSPEFSPAIISAPIPIASTSSSALSSPTTVFNRPVRASNRMTHSVSTSSISPPTKANYVPHHLRHSSASAAVASSRVLISETPSPYGSSSSTPVLSSSVTSTPGMAFSPRTPGSSNRAKRIARKPVPTLVAFNSPFGVGGAELSIMPEMDFGVEPTLTLSTPSFNPLVRRKSTAAELEGGLFAPPSESCRNSTCSSSSSLTSVGRAGAALMATFSSPRSRTSPRLGVPSSGDKHPYSLGSSPALPEIPSSPSLEDSLRNSPILGNIPEENSNNCLSPASSCSAYSSCRDEDETDSDEVLTVPRLSVSSSRTSASEASVSSSQHEWAWRSTTSTASPELERIARVPRQQVGTPSMEESRGKNAKRASVWLPTRVQSNGKMYNISPVIGSLSPTIAEEAWGSHGKRVEEWSGDVLEITLSPRV